MTLLIDTTGLTPADRLDRYQEALADQPVPVQLKLDRPARLLSSRLEVSQLGLVTIARVAHRIDGTSEVNRSAALIRRSDPEIYRLMIHRRGGNQMTQDGRQTALGGRDMAMFDSSRPFQVRFQPGAGRTHEYTMVTFPRSLLMVDANVMRAATSTRFDGTRPLATLVHTFVNQVAGDVDRYATPDKARLATTVLDLMAVWLSSEVDPATHLPADSRNQVLFAQVQSFIAEHLGEAALSPGVIAAAHHISTRTLQALFGARGLTVTGWVRERRLEASRRDLANPCLANVAVATIGYRWALGDAAHFSRAFRAAYGMSPRAFREQCRGS